MKTDLFYFSGTGNSFVVAKDLAEYLGGARLRSMPAALKTGGATDADCIGLVFPVYFSGLPGAVVAFLDGFSPGAGSYIFAVCTYGGVPGGALLQARRQLASRGIALKGGYSVRMPGNYIVKYGAFPAAIQRWILRREKEKVAAIARMVQDRRETGLKKRPALLGGIGAGMYERLAPQLRTMDRHFHVDPGCTRCGTCDTCMRVCPVGNISLTDGAPRWHGECRHCMACLQWCPAAAIQYGGKTGKRKRYHHPGVTAEQMIEANERK